MSNDSREPPDQLEKAVRPGIRAFCSSSVPRREGGLADISSEAHPNDDKALRPLGEQAYARQPINQMPTELFTHLATFFTLPDLFRSALVCRGWRASLLGSPRLWTHVSVSQRSPSASARTSVLLDALFARSHDLPMSVEIQCLDDEYEHVESDPRAYDQIAPVIVAEMSRIRSLSLVVSIFFDTAFENVLAEPAPILACFRLYVVWQSVYIPESLFAHHSPCLTNLALSMVDISPNKDCVAVQSVTDLVHDARVVCTADIDAISRLFPALRSLTFFANNTHIHDGTAACTRPLALRLPNLGTILPVISAFPNATSVCLSSSTYYSDEALSTLFGTVGELTSMELEYRLFQLVNPQTTDKDGDWGVCIKLNGIDMAVDLDWVEADAAVCMLSMRLQDIRSLTVAENLWPLFVPHLAALQSLREVTVYADLPSDEASRWNAGGLLSEYDSPVIPTSPLPKLSLSLLRLVAPQEAYSSGRVEESVVADMVRTMFDPETLRTLVLCGIALVPSEGELRALMPQLNIVQENSPEVPVSPPWFWKFPDDEAIHIP